MPQSKGKKLGKSKEKDKGKEPAGDDAATASTAVQQAECGPHDNLSEERNLYWTYKEAMEYEASILAGKKPKVPMVDRVRSYFKRASPELTALKAHAQARLLLTSEHPPPFAGPVVHTQQVQ